MTLKQLFLYFFGFVGGTPGVPSLRLGFWPFPIFGKWLALWRFKRRLRISALQRHAVVIGKSGSGKSELLKLIILALKSKWIRFVQRKRTVLVLDPHGEVVQECAKNTFFVREAEAALAAGKKPDLVLISPSLRPGYLPTLNPFDLRGQSVSFRMAEVLAQHLTAAFTTMLSKGDMKLSFNMETLLTPMFTVLISMSAARKRTPLTLFDLEQFLDDERNSRFLSFAHNRFHSEGLGQFFRSTFHSPLFRATKFALRVKLSRLLTSRLFVNLLARPRSTWNLEQCMKSGKTVLIDASQSALGREVSEIYGRTITALVQSYAFLRNPSQFHTPVFFLIDEAASFITPEIETILTQSRKYGLHLLLAMQMVKQGGISSGLHDAIMGNTALKILGHSGHRSKKVLSDEMELSTGTLPKLSVGWFVVQRDGAKAEKLKMPTSWLGEKHTVSDSRFAKLRTFFVRQYHAAVSVPAATKSSESKCQGAHQNLNQLLPHCNVPSPFEARGNNEIRHLPEHGENVPHDL
ncbi:helicase HerA domain-containing protein [Acanthopleuribacter pedis]|uniref:DUF87 domain-containing protein n=1 Tax=Acanthopleuribacter pedis TaxID=442870 RepID=A0A8J7QDE5_9BACT|nr:DUF87 domain-containing protein [Acanthopleuribacter pedis]MBO1322482.1 DUF87 domain-containing protein [Acanthopleuribacter pedis]